MSKKLGLVLGAGGSRGVAHIGFLTALDEAGIKPDLITGSSMGSVVGSCYCAGLSPEFMKEEILKLKMSDLFDLSLYDPHHHRQQPSGLMACTHNDGAGDLTLPRIPGQIFPK